MEEIFVRHVELLGFEKRFFPNQHYVYMLMVKWSDLSEKLIYRRYPEIHTFHKTLKEMFPIESGAIEKSDRIIPSLPAPKWLDSHKSTETRQSTLAEYCHSLINLPPHISRCKLVCNLFTVRPEDENPPAPNPLRRNEIGAGSNDKSRDNTSEISSPMILDTYRVISDFTKTSKHEMNATMGELVEIVEKNSNGWWFCEGEFKRGWMPASYLEPLDGPEEAEEAEPDYEGDLHVTTRAYNAQQDDEMSLEAGETIEVIHKLLDGWWVIRRGEETGHFPSMFLQASGMKRSQSDSERNRIQRQTPPPRRSTIRNAQSIHSKGRKRITQDTYRRNSRRYLQQKGGRPNQPRKTSLPSPLQEMKNQDNIPEVSDLSSSEGEMKKTAPIIPPRPSPELIMERCTSDTCKRVSLRKSSSESNS